MAKTFSCSHVHSECSWSATENTEEDLMKKIAEHAKLHGHDTITPDLEAKVKSLIKKPNFFIFYVQSEKFSNSLIVLFTILGYSASGSVLINNTSLLLRGIVIRVTFSCSITADFSFPILYSRLVVFFPSL